MPAIGSTTSTTLTCAARLGASRQFGAMVGRDVIVTVPLDVGVLIERLAGEILHLLADVAADEVADGAADRVDTAADPAGERAERLECAGERRGDDQRVGLSRHGERPARDGDS